MMILCERTNNNSYLLKRNEWRVHSSGLTRNLNGKHYSLDLKFKAFMAITYPEERSRRPIIELAQESLDQMLLLHSLGMGNQEIIEVIKGERSVLTST